MGVGLVNGTVQRRTRHIRIGNEISRLGRLSSEDTYEKWDVTIHDIIDAFRIYKANHPEDTKRLVKFRLLVGNLL